MTEPFLGEIQIFGFNFAPYQWAICGGQTLSVTQNAALFSLIGTYYGGNGTSTFQLPNLASRIACSQGAGSGRSPRSIGETFGQSTVALSQTQMPLHSHNAEAYASRADRVSAPAAGYGLTSPVDTTALVSGGAANTNFSLSAVGVAGSSLPHDNNQPVLALTYAISLYGAYPSFG